MRSVNRCTRLVPVAFVLGVVPLGVVAGAGPVQPPEVVDAPIAREPVAAPPVPVPVVAAVSGPDAVAGIVTRVVPLVGTGAFTVVPGSASAPVPGVVRTVRVEVEDGLPIEPAAFARFVMRTLNDPRGWGRDATFTRTAGAAEIVVRLASPDTTTRLCAPIDTGGPLSCRSGPDAVVNHHRWVEGHPDYRGDLTGYRRYVVNHEVGHLLGFGHVECPGIGAPAPVMQQQSLGLDGCAPNPWPYPG
ncbi:DUF3152 domain-containing protein [Pseudonocardia alaniniphila]|uniref:DUF3152 domain-containing protein n=1 Tax=Pseudonocardia alaniniphila TaxID=75291 RepID=A0ABS9TV77_9PSEU|nr:DUF3152 domain-containing protein [Pseudonocardia alaniniphila]MCH6172469.1 DUF3152 domain-containing protein [Pseudonocardia alaniniphila]